MSRVFVTPTGTVGEGSGTATNPFVAPDLTTVWPNFPDEVDLLDGEFESETLSMKNIRGRGMERTSIQSKGTGGAVVRAKKTQEGFKVSDITLICAAEGVKCGGLGSEAPRTSAERIRVKRLYAPLGQQQYEPFGIITVGDDSNVSHCEVVDWNCDYGTALCPKGRRQKYHWNIVKGPQTGRTMGISPYCLNDPDNPSELYYNQIEGVRFGIYGDTGGKHDPHNERQDQWNWSHIHILRNYIEAFEAGFRIETRDIPSAGYKGDLYSNMLIERNTFKAPKWASVFHTIKNADGDVRYPTTSHVRSLYWVLNTFIGGPHFALAGVPDSCAVWNSFTQQPVGHNYHKPSHCMWSETNSHDLKLLP